MKTVRDLANKFPEMWEFNYKWNDSETPHLTRDIEEVLRERGYMFKDKEDSEIIGMYNDLKGYLNCPVKKVKQ